MAGVPAATPIEIWFQDEARIGQKNGLVRQWARRGTRPRQPADQRYESAYLFGAICPARGTGAALALPHVDTEAMQLHLDEISRNVVKGAHAVLLLDRAGWHTTGKLDVPTNITPIFLPSRAPELNPVENLWQYLRGNWLSNRVFETYDAIIDAACQAWMNILGEPEIITSIGMRDWAHVGQSLGPLVLFDHLVRSSEERGRDTCSRRSDGLEVDDQLHLGRLFYRHVLGVLTLEDTCNLVGDPVVEV